MTWLRSRVSALIFATIFILLSNCSENQVGIDNSPSEDKAAEEIFNSGEKEILRKRYGDAAEKFTEVERLYPYSDWAKRALIMQVYSFHKDQSYENVVSAANRFIEFHPNDKDVPYAYYLIGLSYYDQVLAIGRDQELAKEALRVFSLITKEYPESKYASSSQIRFNFLRDHLASKEMEVGRYYLKRSHYAPAINRFRGVIEEFPTTSQVPEALHRLVEAYLSLGLVNEAQTAGAILGYNYRSTEWYDRTFALLSSKGLKPKSSGNSWLSKIYRQVVKGQWL
ncbi:MAG: outer membrane protein assembly factor BamD [Paracoccaceae bacterium]|jgi:outer membrane protein assembly factor BamD|nr:outer membrane protein assembly factor BamD [Paracoccaceae bacterium]MDG2248677.1 outer membrane protein assembly factor BamD [Paracoccaceae bacterium]|tara:strand:- start:2051 stop:2896 length:846 start_codon:yes stop_codon:yes gene_type:complete